MENAPLAPRGREKQKKKKKKNTPGTLTSQRSGAAERGVAEKNEKTTEKRETKEKAKQGNFV